MSVGARSSAIAEVCALVFVAMIASAACKKAAPAATEDDEKKTVHVTCQPAIVASAADDVSLRGVVTVAPDRDAQVAPAVAGRLTDVRVHEGDRVKAGDLLASVDDPSLTPAVREADAATAAAKANLVNADATLARVKRLLDQGIAPRRDVEDAEAKRASAAAELAAANARADLARRQQSRARVTAPIAGVVVHVMKRAGELVDGTPATPVVEIADSSTLELRADVPPAQLVRIREGTAVAIVLDALPSLQLAGTIAFVSPAIDATTGMGSVRATITPPAAETGVQLKLGLAGKIVLAVASRADVVHVPAVAVRRSSSGGEEVVVCEGGGKAVKAAVREVKVGARTGERVEIVEGVKAGERVVTQHVVGLDDGVELEEGDDKDEADKDKDKGKDEDKDEDKGKGMAAGKGSGVGAR